MARRAENLLPEEEAVGSDDPRAQAEGVLAESDAREAGGAPDSFIERRTSDEAADDGADDGADEAAGPPARPEQPDPDERPDPPEPPD